MRTWLCAVVGFALTGLIAPTWGGPAEEIAELNMKRGQAFSQGNAEAFVADLAENAVFVSSRATFRIEGKNAIRAYFAGLFQTYPQRQSAARQVTTRIYGNDTVVIVNGYADQAWVDRAGHTTNASTRSSTTWMKIDGKWLIVDWHISKLP